MAGVQSGVIAAVCRRRALRAADLVLLQRQEGSQYETGQLRPVLECGIDDNDSALQDASKRQEKELKPVLDIRRSHARDVFEPGAQLRGACVCERVVGALRPRRGC